MISVLYEKSRQYTAETNCTREKKKNANMEKKNVKEKKKKG